MLGNGRFCLCLLLATGATAPGGEIQPGKEVFFGRGFGADPLPAFDKGYLLFPGHGGRLTVYGPDGILHFDADVRNPAGGSASIMNAAVDSDGTVAVTAAHIASSGPSGGIAFLDSAGKPTRFIPTGQYMPAHLTFDRDHSLWVFGWQRDSAHAAEDPQDYFQVRKFSKDGTEIGAYLPRSLFPGKLKPFGGQRGLWLARAASDRIGALAHPSDAGHDPEWIELDLEGKLIGRWKLGRRLDGGLAYTSDARLFTRWWDRKSRKPLLWRLDKEASAWVGVEDPLPEDEFRAGLLLGADGNDLVFAEQGGFRMRWAPAR